MIIGIVGFIGSGKGTVGDFLHQKGFHKDSFAAPLKDATSIIFNWPRNMLEGDTDVSRLWRERSDEYWTEKFGYEFSPRIALQKMGTEVGRDCFHPDIWVISLFNRVKQHNDVVITDVRFKNEIKYIRENGGYVIRVKRGPEPEWYEDALNTNLGNNQTMLFAPRNKIHRSEWDWIGCELDYTIDNDGSLQELDNGIENMLSCLYKIEEEKRSEEQYLQNFFKL